MNNKFAFFTKKAVSVLTAAVLLFSFLTVQGSELTLRASAADTAEKSLNDQISALEKKQKELQAKINSIKNQSSAAAEKKSAMDALTTTVEAKITAAEGLLAELEAKVESTNTEIALRETASEETFEKFRERMRMNHEEGNVSYLSMLIEADSIGDFLSRVEHVNAMLEYDSNLRKQYEKEKTELQKIKDELEASVKLQNETIATLKADKAQAEKLAAEAASYYQTLQKDAATYQKQMAEARAAEEELNRKLEEMLQQSNSAVVANGEYIRPVNGGYISCYYGGKDPNGNAHYAIDIAIAYGTPIYASNSGTVVTATSHSSYGNYVVIDHGSGVSTLYAHCSSLKVSAGQQVTRGQVIAAVGSTGFSTGNHLHFETRLYGKRVNPANYVKF